ncbi:GntR family transcriptional regulator [Streptomyces jumonjinensis]|uniref:GntR family transcriptional regulator n=1 Tax=Streptomyces jumonjinensis TaxID=1945 RepID=A0A646KH47_STRJU|nr:GntR family transcriptional regulator [Streptomyces jumonjinensis]MQT01543.1 GntR family transcriptional regulator [Streptomyces jumonjinensis]
MESQGTGRQPKYQRIAVELKAAIEDGRYGPGDRLPGENDLMAAYAVARMTARQALGVLQTEGLVEARKGAGVFVREYRPIRRRGVQRLSAGLWGEGRSVWAVDAQGWDLEVQSVTVADEKPPEAIGRVLGLAAGASACVRRRRFALDGRPVMLATSYLDAALVSGTAIAEPDTGPGGIYARLGEIGHGPVRFREEIRSRMPTPQETDRLALSAGTPVVLICRTAFTAEGWAVEVNDMVLDSSAYILEYDFTS